MRAEVVTPAEFWDRTDQDHYPAGLVAIEPSAPGEVASLLYSCPCGCGLIRSLPIRAGSSNGPKCWTWNSRTDTPGVSPSIRHLDNCLWHGFLTNGEWSACPDGPPCAG